MSGALSRSWVRASVPHVQKTAPRSRSRSLAEQPERTWLTEAEFKTFNDTFMASKRLWLEGSEQLKRLGRCMSLPWDSALARSFEEPGDCFVQCGYVVVDGCLQDGVGGVEVNRPAFSRRFVLPAVAGEVIMVSHRRAGQP